MKNIFCIFLLVATCFTYSCNGHTSNSKKSTDSAYTGLEGTRDEAGKLSNMSIDTSGGQTIKKLEKSTDSSSRRVKDSLPLK